MEYAYSEITNKLISVFDADNNSYKEMVLKCPECKTPVYLSQGYERKSTALGILEKIQVRPSFKHYEKTSKNINCSNKIKKYTEEYIQLFNSNFNTPDHLFPGQNLSDYLEAHKEKLGERYIHFEKPLLNYYLVRFNRSKVLNCYKRFVINGYFGKGILVKTDYLKYNDNRGERVVCRKLIFIVKGENDSKGLLSFLLPYAFKEDNQLFNFIRKSCKSLPKETEPRHIEKIINEMIGECFLLKMYKNKKGKWSLDNHTPCILETDILELVDNLQEINRLNQYYYS